MLNCGANGQPASACPTRGQLDVPTSTSRRRGRDLNDATKVKFVALTPRTVSPRCGHDIHVLAHSTTWTSRATASSGSTARSTTSTARLHRARISRSIPRFELNDARLRPAGTTTELNLADFSAPTRCGSRGHLSAGRDYAYESGRCDVFTTDMSQLYAEKLKLANPNDHVILPEIISKEPLGPLVRHGDDQWFDVVKWTLFVMLNAEELGISSKTIDDALKSNQPEIRRLLGVEGNFGEQLGLSKDWVVRIIRQVGNYGEVFDRNVGAGSKLGISRGLNRLWTKGGIQYGPPVR
jgi:general L-amino acid transport system substrate-binding protein